MIEDLWWMSAAMSGVFWRSVSILEHYFGRCIESFFSRVLALRIAHSALVVAR
jgi:hypothetical protein